MDLADLMQRLAKREEEVASEGVIYLFPLERVRAREIILEVLQRRR